nr:hypothetical protein [Tanacetum cinerariifolium]
MAALQYKAEHNKVSYLLKPTRSDDYHYIIDFLHSSHIRIETRVTRQYKVLVFCSKLFANMRLNFASNPMPLLPAMLLQAQVGEGAEVAAQDVPHPVPTPDQSPPHLTTPSRP